MKDIKKEYLKNMTRSIPDFPKKGIVFRDISTVIQDKKGMEYAKECLAKELNRIPDKFVGIEARGFIFAGVLSGHVGGGIVMARKKGKLPHETRTRTYELEYGVDQIEIHTDAIETGERVVVIDDLLATGGTALATCQLIEDFGGIVEQVLFLIELPDLKGRDKLYNYNVSSIISFEGE